MKLPVVQKHNYGCGSACVAFVTNSDYGKIVHLMGKNKATSKGFLCKELVKTLKSLGLLYKYCHINSKNQKQIFRNGVIVFMRRCKRFPEGHYLVYWYGFWMDPWINFSRNKDIDRARSGYRKGLPDKPIYGLFPYLKMYPRLGTKYSSF